MTYRTPLPRLLTKAEEQELGAALAAARSTPDDASVVERAEAARRRLIEANIRLVLSLAGRMRLPAGVDRDDVVQDGMIGLERAVERFDHAKGFKFSTYATWWIRQAMQRGLENSAGSIRIPENRAIELRAALRARDEHGQKVPDELAAVERMRHLESLDRSIGDDDAPLADVVVGSAPDPAELAADELLRREVDSLLDDLDAETAEMIARRFGLRGREPDTYRRIADDYAIGEEAVRRRVTRSLQQLRPWAETVVAA